MSKPRRAPGLVRLAFAASILATLTYGFGAVVLAETSEKDPTKTLEKEAPKKVLDGEQLYAINCNRCHSERYPTERTKAQWKTIAMHMRVRANLPPEQVKKILKYLQENN